MKRIVLSTIVLAVAVLVPSPLLVAAADGSVVLAVAGRANATPSIAANGRVVVVAWSASARGATDIYAATSRDGGSTFTSPVRVNDAAASATVSGEQPPRVVLVPRAAAPPAIAVIWTAKTPAGTRIVTARSDDGGRTYGAARTLSGSAAPGNRGWESAAADADGNGLVVWLDHRELAGTGAATTPIVHDHSAMKMPAHDAASVGREQLSKLYVQRLDGGSAAVALTGGVCYCCKTSVVAGPDGAFYSVWRHVYPGNVRDIAFMSSRDGGRTFSAPVRVSQDRWTLDGCPENGPAVTVAGKDVVVVWPTLVSGPQRNEQAMQLFFASTRDGKSFTPRVALPTEGVPRHPQLATLANGAIVAVWDEAANGRRRVVLSEKNVARPAFEGRTVAADAQTAEYPAVAAVDSVAVVVWTSGPIDQSVIRAVRFQR